MSERSACAYYLKELMQWKGGSKGERLEPMRGSSWQEGTKAGQRRMRVSLGRDLVSFTHVNTRVNCPDKVNTLVPL